MELRRYLHLIRQRWILVMLTTLVGALVGLAITPTTAYYRTGTVLYVGSSNLTDNQVQLYALQGLDQIISSFAQMIPSTVITQEAVQATGVPRSAHQAAAETKAAIVPTTSLIAVEVTDRDPVVAQKLADGISNAFVAKVQAIEPSGPGAVPSEPAYVFQDAPLPASPLKTGLTRKVLLGAVFGLILSIALVLLLDYLDITVKGPEELERRLDLPVLAAIPLRRSLSPFASNVLERINVG